METPNLDRIKEIQSLQLSLHEQQERIRQLIQPYTVTLRRLEDDLFTLAKEKLALQTEAILERKQEEKKQQAITRELNKFAQEFGDEARDLMKEILRDRGN